MASDVADDLRFWASIVADRRIREVLMRGAQEIERQRVVIDDLEARMAEDARSRGKPPTAH